MSQMFIFQPSSNVPISPFFFDFENCKLVRAAALPYLLESPAFTASLACGWKWLATGRSSCGLPNHLRKHDRCFLLFILTWRNLFDLQFGGETFHCKDSTGGPGWAPDSLPREWGDLDRNGVLTHHRDYGGGGQGGENHYCYSSGTYHALRAFCMLSQLV